MSITIRFLPEHGDLRWRAIECVLVDIMLLTLCLLGNFACFFVVCCFFFKSTFSKNSFMNTIRVSNSLDFQIRPDILSGLIWVQTVCKGNQQMTLVDRVKVLPASLRMVRTQDFDASEWNRIEL